MSIKLVRPMAFWGLVAAVAIAGILEMPKGVNHSLGLEIGDPRLALALPQRREFLSRGLSLCRMSGCALGLG
jgi:hypothetical protein